ncbi:MAG: hypothetical protein LBH08_01205, partial [Puniceicoccales bacterium]|nr:hypothetical protein [Puniceicoccales bacterium]
RGIPGKTPHQCREHWFNIAPGINRNKWTTGEDEKLLALVEAHGAGNWVLIAKGLSGRTSLQCRYRYYRYLRLSQGFAPNGDPDAAPVASGQQVETLRFPSLPVDEDSDAASGQQVETYPFSSLLVDEDSNAASGQQEEAYLFLSPPVDGDFLPIRY